jgi:DNA-directed RNA polymerase subunit RPC12/RpoP
MPSSNDYSEPKPDPRKIDIAKAEWKIPCTHCGFRMLMGHLCFTDETHVLCPACGEVVLFLKRN